MLATPNKSSMLSTPNSALFTLSSLVWNIASHRHYSHKMDTMSSQNLETASQYVNNLLLSRGLLRNGTPLEFANPSKGKGGMEATMAKVINLIHDLVLRRDVCALAFGLVYLLTFGCVIAGNRVSRRLVAKHDDGTDRLVATVPDNY